MPNEAGPLEEAHLSDGQVREEFNRLVNIPNGELRRWLDCDESKSVGALPKGAGIVHRATDGESVGHASGRRIIEIRSKPASKLTPDDYRHMRKVVGYIRRHRAQRPRGERVATSRWRYSLMNWGHDPLHEEANVAEIELDEDLQIEASLAGISPVAAGRAAPGVVGPEVSETENPYLGLTGPQMLSPGQIVAANKRPRTATSPYLSFFRSMVHEGAIGTVAAAYEVDDCLLVDVDILTEAGSVTVKRASYLDFDEVRLPLSEKAPPDQKVEQWILDNKAEFKRRYGKEWRRYLYGHAWRLHGHLPSRKAMGEAHTVAVRLDDGSVRVTSRGPAGSGRTRALQESARGLLNLVYEDSAHAGPDADCPYSGEGFVSLAEKAKEDPAWAKRRPATPEERGRLRVPAGELECTVCHVPGKGFVAHTHRARTGYYKSPEAIPAKALRFVSSTS